MHLLTPWDHLDTCIYMCDLGWTCRSPYIIFFLQQKMSLIKFYVGRAKRIWYLSPMRAAKVQASLRIRAVSPEPPLLAHTSSESRGTFRRKARSLAPLNGWACAVKICHDGMLEDTNSLDSAHIFSSAENVSNQILCYNPFNPFSSFEINIAPSSEMMFCCNVLFE